MGFDYEQQAKKILVCPYCAGLLPIVGVNDLQTTNPELIKEWDYTKKYYKTYEIKGRKWDENSGGSVKKVILGKQLQIIGKRDRAVLIVPVRKYWQDLMILIR